MCNLLRNKQQAAVKQIIPSSTGISANRDADIEARLRRARAGAAADVLTSARGIPATRTLGGIAV